MKIIITGGKSALALKMLKAFEQYEVVLADYGEMPNFSTASCAFFSLGPPNEDTIAHTLLNSCLDAAVDMILPLQVEEVIQVAKANVLFSEFNIEVLLPSDIVRYTNPNLPKYEDWVVFKKGEVLFSTVAHAELFAFGKSADLTGAFYFNVQNAVANLKLITL